MKIDNMHKDQEIANLKHKNMEYREALKWEQVRYKKLTSKYEKKTEKSKKEHERRKELEKLSTKEMKRCEEEIMKANARNQDLMSKMLKA